MSDNELIHKTETDHLKELILKSGFPLEIEIASYLGERSTLMSDWGISTSAHYLDSVNVSEKPLFQPFYRTK
jgi:hypothetical protein